MPIHQLRRGACAVALISAMAVTGCSSDDSDKPATTTTGTSSLAAGASAADTADAMQTYADLVVANYDSVDRVGQDDADHDRGVPGRNPTGRDARRREAGLADRP